MKSVFTLSSVLPFLSCVLLASLALLSVPAQELPPKIRGYKVHPEKIIVTSESGSFTAVEDRKVSARVGEPKLADVSITGLTLSVSAVLDPVEHSGDVHFITFRDFKVNGFPVEVEKYRQAFSFKKNEKIVLPKAATIFIPARQLLNAAWSEISGSKEEWTVTGRLFVFGKFRKLGFSFKRVVPVEVNLTIKNPLRSHGTKLSS